MSQRDGSSRTTQKPSEVPILYLYYTILYYTILYYTILYYTILYYTILYCTILYYTVASLGFSYQQIQLHRWNASKQRQSPCRLRPDAAVKEGSFKQFWAIFDHFEPFRTTLSNFGQFSTILDHLKQFWAILDHFGPFWAIWGNLGPIETLSDKRVWSCLAEGAGSFEAARASKGFYPGTLPNTVCVFLRIMLLL